MENMSRKEIVERKGGRQDLWLGSGACLGLKTDMAREAATD